MKDVKSYVSIKVIEHPTGGAFNEAELDSFFNRAIELGDFSYIYFTKPMTREKVEKYFGEAGYSFSQAYDGCYGSSSGETLPGIKVYVPASKFPDRFIDSGCDEIVNIEKLCHDFGELVGLPNNVDADSFMDALWEVDSDNIKSDNTYNYMGHNTMDVLPLCHADFYAYCKDWDSYEHPIYVSIKFHCGGDIRGNYSDYQVFKFDSIDDYYSALVPSPHLIDECDRELAELKRLIDQCPKDVELLKREFIEKVGA